MKDYQSPLNSNTINDIPEAQRKRSPVERCVIATAEHFKRLNKKLSAMSDEKAVELLDKVFNEHECTPMDEAFMKQIADLVEGVEL